ncbi:MAG: phosphoribosylaminoimidazolesuccinocarboxamide synthase [Spirochaetia bacterium]|jgi:phosphoribosylaminoimidazole-succinocarboxamide synthase|nr:phosphoribosylaminoimidazolesuccinocarboxamide synthase [Spirochaetia bacterium]
MKDEIIIKNLGKTFKGIEKADISAGSIAEEAPAGEAAGTIRLFKGKVRDVIDLGKELLIITSDRISAFDVILSTIPFKGEVLNKTSLFWFRKTSDIIKNHILEEISPRTVRVKKCKILPVEVIVRGYLTGSAWRDYSKGKDISGIALPKGMKFNQRFEKPLLTPSTKAEAGEHDAPISAGEIVSKGLVGKKIWDEVENKAASLFARGSELAAENGLILVDTKYEFGLLDGKLMLADEIHTPDSSRFWYSDTYEKLYSENKEQRQLDKEYFRKWLIDRGYMGEGEIPEITDHVRVETAKRYIDSYENITGKIFTPEAGDSEAEKKKIVLHL